MPNRRELPSPASTSTWNDYLSVKSQYVLSYNSARKIPNWVSWELNSSYLGSASRQDTYRTDSRRQFADRSPPTASSS